jgi:hypothetical protein
MEDDASEFASVTSGGHADDNASVLQHDPSEFASVTSGGHADDSTGDLQRGYNPLTGTAVPGSPLEVGIARGRPPADDDTDSACASAVPPVGGEARRAPRAAEIAPVLAVLPGHSGGFRQRDEWMKACARANASSSSSSHWQGAPSAAPEHDDGAGSGYVASDAEDVVVGGALPCQTGNLAHHHNIGSDSDSSSDSFLAEQRGDSRAARARRSCVAVPLEAAIAGDDDAAAIATDPRDSFEGVDTSTWDQEALEELLGMGDRVAWPEGANPVFVRRWLAALFPLRPPLAGGLL